MNIAHKTNDELKESDGKLHCKIIDLNSINKKSEVYSLEYVDECVDKLDGKNYCDDEVYTLSSSGDDHYDEDNEQESMAVQPLIGDEIRRAKEYLLNAPARYKRSVSQRYTLFCFGISVGLRVSDLIALKIFHVVKDGKIKDSFMIKEGKTKKKREIFLRSDIKELLVEYINGIGEWKYNYYLFHPRNNYDKQMTRQNVNYMMKNIEKGLNLDVNLGTHSLRKTFARAVFDMLSLRNDVLAIEKLQDILGHEDVKTTRMYIGLKREKDRKIYLDENLGI